MCRGVHPSYSNAHESTARLDTIASASSSSTEACSMSRVCTSSLDAIFQAVASLTLSEADGRSAKGAYPDAKIHSSLAAGLRDLSSGHLAVEAPDRVDATVESLLPALCDPNVASRLNWRAVFSEEGIPQDEAAARTVAFLAARAAASLSRKLDLEGSYDSSGGGGVFVGVLGEATRLLQACSTLLDLAFASERPRLSDGMLADLLFSCERVAGSGRLTFPSEGVDVDKVMARLITNLRSDAVAIATLLEERLPSYGKRTSTISELIVRLWTMANPHEGLHHILCAALRVEDSGFSCSRALRRLSLVSVSRVVRALVDKLNGDEIAAALQPIMSVTLPLASDISRQRRLDGLHTIARVVKLCSRNALLEHGIVLISALTTSLGGGDCATALLAVPVLAEVLAMVYPDVALADEPPTAWKEAFDAVVIAFTNRVTRPIPDVDEADQKLLTAAAIAIYIPRIAKARLLQQMESITCAMEAAQVKASRAVCQHGTTCLPAFTAIQEAYVEVLRYTWPRVPAHVETIIRGAFVSVMSARGAQPEVLSQVVGLAAELLVWAAKCGHRRRFDRILEGLRPAATGYSSLAPAAELHAAVVARLKKLDTPEVAADMAVAGNALVKTFLHV
jgi:hypothetical protein